MSKADFVEELSNFYINCVGNPIGIESLSYFKDSNNDEWIYVHCAGGSEKRVNVSGDSNNGMLIDFMNFLGNRDSFRWISKNDEDYI